MVFGGIDGDILDFTIRPQDFNVVVSAANKYLVARYRVFAFACVVNINPVELVFELFEVEPWVFSLDLSAEELTDSTRLIQ